MKTEMVANVEVEILMYVNRVLSTEGERSKNNP